MTVLSKDPQTSATTNHCCLWWLRVEVKQRSVFRCAFEEAMKEPLISMFAVSEATLPRLSLAGWLGPLVDLELADWAVLAVSREIEIEVKDPKEHAGWAQSMSRQQTRIETGGLLA